MTSRQTAGVFQLVGLASLGYGVYHAWAQYSQYAQFATFFVGEDGQTRYIVDQLFSNFGLDFFSLLGQEPWVWIGAALVIAPFLVGLTHSSPSGSGSSPHTPSSSQLYVDCPACRGAVLENAPFCPHCGKARG